MNGNADAGLVGDDVGGHAWQCWVELVVGLDEEFGSGGGGRKGGSLGVGQGVPFCGGRFVLRARWEVGLVCFTVVLGW